MVNFKIADWTTNITIHVLPNISGSKDNETIKFGQLIEYNLRNLFLGKYGREASPKRVLGKCPRAKLSPNPKTNSNPNPTLTGGQFSSGAIVQTP